MGRIRPHWRKMTWAIIGWSALMLTWIIVGASSAKTDYQGPYQHAKELGAQTGTAIGVGALIGLWFMGFVVLSLIWFMTRRRAEKAAT